jgi:hypothetical protein
MLITKEYAMLTRTCRRILALSLAVIALTAINTGVARAQAWAGCGCGTAKLTISGDAAGIISTYPLRITTEYRQGADGQTPPPTQAVYMYAGVQPHSYDACIMTLQLDFLGPNGQPTTQFSPIPPGSPWPPRVQFGWYPSHKIQQFFFKDPSGHCFSIVADLSYDAVGSEHCPIIHLDIMPSTC